jgi:hypothetical protein
VGHTWTSFPIYPYTSQNQTTVIRLGAQRDVAVGDIVLPVVKVKRIFGHYYNRNIYTLRNGHNDNKISFQATASYAFEAHEIFLVRN